MQKSLRKCSLDELTHKNRNQILYYISEVKVQIYSHCLIAYDPKLCLTSSDSNKDMSDIYSDEFSQLSQKKIKIQKSLNLSNNNHVVSFKKSINGENCPKEAHENIKKFDNGSQSPNNGPLSLTKHSSFSENLQNLETTNQQKVVYFNNPDIAFYLNEKSKTIQIYTLATKTLQIGFQIKNSQTLIIVQTILRKKLCELGFYKKYKLIKLLGKGATAQVQLVQRVSDKKTFAAKIISTLNSNEKQFELFVNEAKLLRILKHKNIINLESVYIHKHQLIQVLEYVPGGTLLEVLKNKQITTRNQRWAALKDLTQGLQYLRQRRIVHRDLKLQNIMVRKSSRSTQFIITDFGLACWNGQKNPVYEKCGTPGYIAPQVLKTSAKFLLLDHRIDIFSLGVIAHIIFLREPLFHFQGCIKSLIQQNKRAQYNLRSKKYQCLSNSQLNFLMLTLQKDIYNRVTSEQLLKVIKMIGGDNDIKKTPQKMTRRLSFEAERNAVEVQFKKETYLNKKAIKIDIQSINKQKQSENLKQGQQSSPRKKSIVGSARKAISSFWQTISPTHKKQRLKFKQNSVERQRRYSDYVRE